MTIDALYYIYVNNDVHRHRQIKGYCENNPAGDVRVGFHFGKCSGHGVADAYSC